MSPTTRHGSALMLTMLTKSLLMIAVNATNHDRWFDKVFDNCPVLGYGKAAIHASVGGIAAAIGIEGECDKQLRLAERATLKTSVATICTAGVIGAACVAGPAGAVAAGAATGALLAPVGEAWKESLVAEQHDRGCGVTWEAPRAPAERPQNAGEWCEEAIPVYGWVRAHCDRASGDAATSAERFRRANRHGAKSMVAGGVGGALTGYTVACALEVAPVAEAGEAIGESTLERGLSELSRQTTQTSPLDQVVAPLTRTGSTPWEALKITHAARGSVGSLPGGAGKVASSCTSYYTSSSSSAVTGSSSSWASTASSLSG